ncbi:dihydrofolate reductase family protein [Haloechinothrix sp. YIM 98757]|uniref:Dihydrofolate reductase family protein n=1 Tax=Haloechinothrix aidingensis TaxID=2752311 RepID=A0A838AEV6_9PSEU|nr:dihydrofolate reductase family protein [Haloechinothrix aidingensis]MBA0127839.1 dihydrofolate reductase family protein [Haloechinothrix aidingensis]
MTQRVRVQCFTVTSNGIGAGEDQDHKRPFGHVDPKDLMAWRFATGSWMNHSDVVGTRGIDDYVERDYARGIGAEIMGRNKFGPIRGEWPDHEWQGWWGNEPPFHTPVFVLTHYPRPSFTLADTTFHFLQASPHDALEQAKAAAGDNDVRIGGGVTTVRAFLDAGLVDEMHVAVAPYEVSRGLQLWTHPDELTDRFHLERVPSSSGVVHHFFWRR